MRTYVVDRFDMDMLGYRPERVIIDKITKEWAIIDLTTRTDEDVLINTITDDETLNYLKKELNVELEKPEKVKKIEVNRGDALVIVLKRGQGVYDFYESLLLF